MMHARTIVPGLCLWLAMAGPCPAAPGSILTVTGDVVNIRGGPSLVSAVLLQVRRGQELLEISRRNDWVEVETGRDDHPRGWIHSGLVEGAPAGDGTGDREAEMRELFGLFEQAFSEYQQRKQSEFGFRFFADATIDAEGTVTLTATPSWLRQPMDQRMQDLSDIFDIWAAAAGEGVMITINVVDRNDERHMSMFR